MSDNEIQIDGGMNKYNNIQINYNQESSSDNEQDVSLGLDLLANSKKMILENEHNNNINDNDIDINQNKSPSNIHNNNIDDIIKSSIERREKEQAYESNSSHRSHRSHRSQRSQRSKHSQHSQHSQKSRISNHSSPTNNNYKPKIEDTSDESEPTPTQRQYQQFPTRSLDEILKEKQDLLYEIDRLKKRGAKFSRDFNISSNIEDMKLEISRIKTIRDGENGIKLCRKVLMCCCSGLEWANNRWDPFSVQLDGWSESIHEDISSYDEVFEELYQKYKTEGNIPAEIRLLFMIISSAVMFHITNSMFKSSMPQFQNFMKPSNLESESYVPPAPQTKYTRPAKPANSGGNPMDLLGGLGGLGNMMPGLGNLMGMVHGDNNAAPFIQEESENYENNIVEIEEEDSEPLHIKKSPVKKINSSSIKPPELAGLDTLLEDLSDTSRSTTRKRTKKVLNLG